MLNDMWADGGKTPDPYFSDELDTALIDYMLSLQEKLDNYQYVTSVDISSMHPIEQVSRLLFLDAIKNEPYSFLMKNSQAIQIGDIESIREGFCTYLADEHTDLAQYDEFYAIRSSYSRQAFLVIDQYLDTITTVTQ